MDDPFARLWWVLALRGVAGLALAVLAFVWPFVTLEALLFGVGLYAVADGGVALYAGLERREHGYPYWPFAVEGAIGLLAGGAIIAFPDAMAFALWYVVAGWAVATGACELVAAIRLRRVCAGERLLAAAGIASLGLGWLMFIWPGAAMVSLAWLIGAYAAMFGALLLGLGLRLRSMIGRELMLGA
jgi:uncharacterized membrane protein HdeD (DUF308 family)